MKRFQSALLVCVAAVAVVGASGCAMMSKRPARVSTIVGTWYVKDSQAPFRYHLYVFNADGTMQQANPDAGNGRTSDSDGKGLWVVEGPRIRGKFVEISADRASRKFLSRGEISYVLTVDGDRFTGTAAARFYDENDQLIQGPIPTDLSGKRVTLP